MAKKKSKLKVAQEEAQAAVNKTNEKIEELGGITATLYSELSNTAMSLRFSPNIMLCVAVSGASAR